MFFIRWPCHSVSDTICCYVHTAIEWHRWAKTLGLFNVVPYISINPYIFAWLSLKRSVSSRAQLMWIHSAFNQNVISMRIKLGDLLRNIIKPKSKYDCIEKKLAKYDIYRHTCYCLSSVKQFEYDKQWQTVWAVEALYTI